MSGRVAAALLFFSILTACGGGESPVLTVSGITVFAPLPGQPAGVAYFTLQNPGPDAVILRRISSPDFTAAEMHTTLVEGGVAQMFPVDSFTVAEYSEVEFTPGGMHLMLLNPRQDLDTGNTVVLEFHYVQAGTGDKETEGSVSVDAPVLAR